MAESTSAPDRGRIRALLVDDDQDFLDLARYMVERDGDISVDTTRSSKDALARLEEGAYDAVVSDFMMPEIDGIELLKILRAKGCELPFIMLTGRGREDVAVNALNLGADYYVEKGTDPKSQFADLVNFIRQSVSRRRAIVSLREGDRFLRRVFSSIQDGLCVLSRDLTIRSTNPTLERWYSHMMPLVGKRCSEVFPAGEPSVICCPAEESLRTKKSASAVFPRKGADGETMGWVEVHSYPITSEDGAEVEGVIEYMRDVTDRVKAERRLESELGFREEFTSLTNALIAAVGSIRRESEIVLEYGKRLTGSAHGFVSPIDPETRSVISQTITDMFGDECRMSPEDGGIVFPVGEDGLYPRLWGVALNKRKAFFTNEPVRHECYVGVPEGHVPLDNFLAAPVVLGDDLVGVIAFANSSEGYGEKDLEMVERLAGLYALVIQHERDVQSITNLDQRFRSFMDNTPAVAYMKDREGRYVYVNRAFTKLLAVDEEDILGSRDEDMWSPEVARALQESDGKVLATGRPLEVVEVIPIGNGDREYISYKFPVFDSQGRLTLVGGVSVDVTDLRRYEKEVEVANEKLKMLGSLTRHDSLNQLSALEGWVGLALEAAEDGEVRDYLEKIMSPIENLRLQLEFAAEYDQIGLAKPVWIDVESECRETADSLDMDGVELRCDTGSLEILADPMFTKVFHNLFENALKHGENVTRITVTAEEDEDGLRLVVEDDGVGVRPEDKEMIFEKGYGENTGLGLYMIRELMRFGGMSIAETGTRGEGARFEIRIPRGRYRLG